jgi:predicted HicB family RNase H-like nuclease
MYDNKFNGIPYPEEVNIEKEKLNIERDKNINLLKNEVNVLKDLNDEKDQRIDSLKNQLKLMEELNMEKKLGNNYRNQNFTLTDLVNKTSNKDE